MIPRLLISLSEKDKRVILIFFLLIIVAIAFIAIIGAIITRVMKWQGKRMDDLTHDVVVTNVIDNKKDFLRYARIKNWYTFFKQAWKPLLILLATSLIIIIHNGATNNWQYDMLDYEKTGFNTLFFIWDFNDPNIYHSFFGIKMICDWPTIINYPHFSLEAWASYLFFFGMIIGGAWYLVALQCVIARTIRMYKLSYDLYRKSLDGYNKYQADQQQLK
ncbi:MAG: hypothetical protein E7175_03915 [Erysipelotrichaceae bacterium]|nr:hypothetical protein [Erysipelotrichaceae bacterium]